MKSCFTKESKILAHNEKEVLYSRLLQSAEEQQQKLQLRLEEMDGLLKEAENCLIALGAGMCFLTEDLKTFSDTSTLRFQGVAGFLTSVLLVCLCRTLSDLEAENEQMLVQMEQLKEEEKTYQELLERCDHTEWDMTEWSEQRAVFSFLYDSVELTLGFGPPVDGDEFGEDPSRQIVSLNFESLLDEEKAPPSSCLVQRLIFQFIDSQGCWQEKCPTMHHLPQALRDISVVVSHCKGLGEEMEFLERWGGKYNLLKTDIDGTRVKLLFSSSPAHAKFELTLSLSATYPALPLPFTVHTHIGNIGEKEVSAVLSEVPVGCRYLRRIVTSIHQNLLQKPS
ncbi:KNL1 protein, partial [Brachypteracias leptosomus]|nr:KNL1 protein [Brachypteracias leptosomus]